MMLLIGILFTFVLGWLFLWAIEGESDFSLLTRIGGSWLIGIGLQTLGMAFMDILGIGLSISSVWGFSAVVSLALAALQFRRPIPFQLDIKKHFDPIDFKRINLVWLLLFGLSLKIIYGTIVKGLFFPTFAFDAVAGYDLMAQVVVTEGSWANSLFDPATGRAINGSAHRLIYPPFTSGSMAYAYMLGSDLPKWPMLLHYTSFLLLLYGLLHRQISHTASLFLVTLVIFTPEMTAHASLSLSNLPQAIFVVAGMLSLYTWTYNKRQGHLLLGLTLLALNTWVRSEGVLFVLIAAPLLLWPWKERPLSRRILYSFGFLIIGLSPFLFWQGFLSYFGLKPDVDNPQLLSLSWNPEKLARLWRITVLGFETRPALFFSSVYYGWSMHLFVLFVPLTIYSAIKQPKERENMLAFFYICAASVVGFFTFYYFIDYSWDSIEHVLSYSFKRGLFCIMPLLLLYCGLHPLSRKAFRWLDRWWYGPTKAAK